MKRKIAVLDNARFVWFLFCWAWVGRLQFYGYLEDSSKDTLSVCIANTKDIRKHSILSWILRWWFTNIYVGNFQAIYICLIKQYRKWVFSIRTLKGPLAPASINTVDNLSGWTMNIYEMKLTYRWYTTAFGNLPSY